MRSVFVLSSNLVLPTEKTESWKRFLLKSVGFGRFMTLECNETLILAFTSKTGQSVAHNRHGIFIFGFFYQREDVLRHFIGLTRTVRGSDYSPAIELSEQKDKLVTATGDTEKYSENQANKVWLNSVY